MRIFLLFTPLLSAKKMERKKELRKRIALLKNQHADSTMRKLQSANILTALEAHPAFRAANTVLLYHSLNDEVDTHEFIQKWSNKKRILLPVVAGDDLELRHFFFFNGYRSFWESFSFFEYLNAFNDGSR